MGGIRNAITILLIAMDALSNAGTEGWENWSDWTPSGTCEQNNRVYVRSRVCVNPSSTVYCMIGEWDVQYQNNTVSSCSHHTETIILGVVTVITLIVMVTGTILGIMCLRLWINRTAYNVRQARQASERIDNVPVYHNVMLSQSSSNDTLKTDDEKGPDIELCAINDPDKTYSGHNGGIPAIGVPVILNAELLRDNATKLTVTAEDSEENCLMDEPHDESDEKTTYF